MEAQHNTRDSMILSNSQKRLAGYLAKIENRAIGGPAKRKYWFVIDDESPFLYWYKHENDISSVGRVPLFGSAFTFDPRFPGRFEIHTSGEIHILEAIGNKERDRWMKQLQSNRRRHYEKESVDEILNVDVMSRASQANTSGLSELQPLGTIDAGILPDSFSSASSSTVSPQNQPGIKFSSDTKFYLNQEGELLPSSLDTPPVVNLKKSAEEFIGRVVDETQNTASRIEEPAKKVFGRARKSIKLPSFSSKNQCEHCKELNKVVEELKNQCYELTDELSATQDLVNALKNGIVVANNQRDALKILHSASEQERLDFALERESLVTSLQLNQTDLKREMQMMKEEKDKLETEVLSLQASMEAFRESVKTKDELIVKICEDKESLERQNMASKRFSVTEAVDIGIPEGIPVDGGTPTEKATQALFAETNVDDIDEMRDLVIGYESQNKFLNYEVLQLQKIVEALEEREKKIIRQNFEIEACFYQLKSRYMMVLNHFKSGFDEAKKKLQPEVIEELLEDVSRPLAFQHRTDSVTSKKPSLSIIVNTASEAAETDALGFYLQSRKPTFKSSTELDNNVQKTGDQIVDKAAELKSLSDQIVKNIQIEKSEKYLEWLEKWDCFLVNHSISIAQPLNKNNELKQLVRQGIPHAYRSRVWKALVHSIVSNLQADTGCGYYNCLLQKSAKIDSETDPALRQIDLDLLRTLPTNMHFNDLKSEKMVQLKRVLYAFRFHNKQVEYCQGLNRIAAVGLLYLKEDDAFWFLVAVVEFLQPKDYYTPTLIGAVVDQKVLMDLVQEKIPKLFNHLKQLQVDLSLFTLPWFLTVFVDVLGHELFLNIFDAFLLEGNKVIFRFAIALLKTCEQNLMNCTTLGGVHACFTNLMTVKVEPKDLAKIAFNNLMSFPSKLIECRREWHTNQLKPKDG